MKSFQLDPARAAVGFVATTLTLAMLTACGPKDAAPAAKSGAPAGAAEAPPRVAATAAEVAAVARGNLSCPAKVATPARATDAPAHDVLGVRPGMTYEEAAASVMCTHDLMVVTAETHRGVRMNTHGHTLRQGFSARLAEPKINKSSKEIMKEMQDRSMARSGNAIVYDLKPGQAKWFVGTMGLPGQERVINAAREEWFEEGRQPTIAKVEEALRGKYGAPSRIQQSPGTRQLTWIQDPAGRLLAEKVAGRSTQCQGTPQPEGGANFTPDCGVVVAAIISSTPTNADLARSMQVGVVDMAGGYAAIVNTEKGLAQLDAQRRAKEVEKAAKDSSAPRI